MFSILSSILYSLNAIICEILALIIEWIFKLIDIVGIDTKKVTTLFSNAEMSSLLSIFKTVGVWLALLFFVWGIFQFLFPSTEIELPADNPFMLVFRFVLSLLFVNYFYSFYNDQIYERLITPIFNAVNTGLKSTQKYTEYLGTSALGSLLSGFSFTSLQQIVNLIITIVFMGVFVVSAFKFVIYHFERLFEATILLYFSPVAASTYTLKPTSTIFKTYIKMLVQQGICLIVNIMTTKLILAGLLRLNSTAEVSAWDITKILQGGLFGKDTKNFVINMMILTACLNVGKRASVYVAQLMGMNGMADSVKNGLGALGFLGGIAMGGLRHAPEGVKKLKDKIGSNNPKPSVVPDGPKEPGGDDSENKIPESAKNTSSEFGGKSAYTPYSPLSGTASKLQNDAKLNKAKQDLKNAQQQQTQQASEGDGAFNMGEKAAQGATTEDKQGMQGMNDSNNETGSNSKMDESQNLQNPENAQNPADTENARKVPNGIDQNGQQNPKSTESTGEKLGKVGAVGGAVAGGIEGGGAGAVEGAKAGKQAGEKVGNGIDKAKDTYETAKQSVSSSMGGGGSEPVVQRQGGGSSSSSARAGSSYTAGSQPVRMKYQSGSGDVVSSDKFYADNRKSQQQTPSHGASYQPTSYNDSKSKISSNDIEKIMGE